VWLGGDRAATDGSLDRTLIKEPKIFRKGSIGFGVCGLPKVMDAIQHAFKLPAYNGGDPKTWLVSDVVPGMRETMKKLECTFVHNEQQHFMGAILIAFKGRLFQLEGNFQLVEAARGFDSVGSGAPAALGSLRETKGASRKRILKALAVSAENNAGVAPPFDVIEIKMGK